MRYVQWDLRLGYRFGRTGEERSITSGSFRFCPFCVLVVHYFARFHLYCLGPTSASRQSRNRCAGHSKFSRLGVSLGRWVLSFRWCGLLACGTWNVLLAACADPSQGLGTGTEQSRSPHSHLPWLEFERKELWPLWVWYWTPSSAARGDSGKQVWTGAVSPLHCFDTDFLHAPLTYLWRWQ